ncbi:hypothetical protein AC249_AIPGENE7196 [Exaiptasia diaphana]|nr:hypothetical protein AC249_AIPGENE7196 [Exaiptasia diaphana]
MLCLGARRYQHTGKFVRITILLRPAELRSSTSGRAMRKSTEINQGKHFLPNEPFRQAIYNSWQTQVVGPVFELDLNDRQDSHPRRNKAIGKSLAPVYQDQIYFLHVTIELRSSTSGRAMRKSTEINQGKHFLPNEPFRQAIYNSWQTQVVGPVFELDLNDRQDSHPRRNKAIGKSLAPVYQDQIYLLHVTIEISRDEVITTFTASGGCTVPMLRRRPRGRVDYELIAHEAESARPKSARPNGLLARSLRGRDVIAVGIKQSEPPNTVLFVKGRLQL